VRTSPTPTRASAMRWRRPTSRAGSVSRRPVSR
jgi:hypothetical protein